MSECPCPKHPFGCYRHPKECGCSPDPTRAALEECVRAMERAMQRSNESGTGEMRLIDTIHAVHGILREAHTTARNALGTEK